MTETVESLAQKLFALELKPKVTHCLGKDDFHHKIERQAVALARKQRQWQRERDTTDQIEATYDCLDGEWHDWLEVARKYERRVPAIDRYDIRHIILLELNRARERDGKPLPILRAYRIASLTVALYWRIAKKQPVLLSLDDDVVGLQLKDTVADDKAIDLEAWQDAKTWRLGCPLRLIEIAHKKLEGIALDQKDHKYLQRYRKQAQKSLF